MNLSYKIKPTPHEANEERALMEIRDAGDMGKGVFARVDIPKNKKLMVYPGHVFKNSSDHNATYTWDFMVVTGDPGNQKLVSGYQIDAGNKHGALDSEYASYLAPYVNQGNRAKDNNVAPVMNFLRRPEPALEYWSIKDIPAGSQLFINYRREEGGNWKQYTSVRGKSVQYVYGDSEQPRAAPTYVRPKDRYITHPPPSRRNRVKRNRSPSPSPKKRHKRQNSNSNYVMNTSQSLSPPKKHTLINLALAGNKLKIAEEIQRTPLTVPVVAPPPKKPPVPVVAPPSATPRKKPNVHYAYQITDPIFDKILNKNKREAERQALIHAKIQEVSWMVPIPRTRIIADVNREMERRNRVKEKQINHEWIEEVQHAGTYLVQGSKTRYMTNFSRNQTPHMLPGNEFTYGKVTLLMYAAYWGNVNLVKKVVGAGVDVNARDRDGRTAVMYASMRESGNTNERKDIIQYLCKQHGADVNAQDKFGRTALMRAAEAGNLPIVAELDISGARKDIQDTQGRTALTYAAIHGRDRVVRSGALLMYGWGWEKVAKMKDSHGLTAMQYAEKYRHPEIVDILKNYV